MTETSKIERKMEGRPQQVHPMRILLRALPDL